MPLTVLAVSRATPLTSFLLFLALIFSLRSAGCPSFQAEPSEIKTTRPQPRSQVKRTSAAQKSHYLSVPFDLFQQLPRDFHGHDAKFIYQALESLIDKLGTKSEFETTAEFKLRRNNMALANLVDRLAVSDLLAIVVPQGDVDVRYGNGLPCRYDADTQHMEVSLPSRKRILTLESPPLEIISVGLNSSIVDRDSYQGTNAFGATVRVVRTYTHTYSLAFPSNHSVDELASPRALRIQMTPTVALEVKNALRFLVLGRLEAPWIYQSVSGHEPTITSPHDSLDAEMYLHMIPVQVWLFDQKTGRVLKRISTETIAAEKEETRRAIATAITAKQEQRRRVFPLVIDVAASVGIFDIMIDGDTEHRIRLFPSSQRRIFDASREIVIKCLFERYSDALNVKVNGLPYQPTWKKDADGNLIDLITMRQAMDQK